MTTIAAGSAARTSTVVTSTADVATKAADVTKATDVAKQTTTSTATTSDAFEATGPTGSVKLGSDTYTVKNGSVFLDGARVGSVDDQGAFDVTIKGARATGNVSALHGAAIEGTLSTGAKVDNRATGLVSVGADTFDVRGGEVYRQGQRIGTMDDSGRFAVSLNGQAVQGSLADVKDAQFVGVRADGSTVAQVKPNYPSSIYAGWDPKTGVENRSAGTGRISQDPNNPFKDLSGPPGARTGATFIEVIPTQSAGSPPGSIELANTFVLGGPYSDRKPPAHAPSGVMLTDFSGRVADYKKYGSEADVAKLLETAKTPEELAKGLDAMGGYVTASGAYSPFGVTSAITGKPGKTDFSPQFALGNYAQVATYLAANPDVKELAKQHPGLHPHVVAEWHFTQQGRAEGREWPKEVTLLPNFNQVVGYGATGSDPYSRKVAQGYLDRNPDVAELAKASGQDPISFAINHYDRAGRMEGRSMGPRNYIGNASTGEDFERYYRGEMSKEEAHDFWNPGGDQVESSGSAGAGGSRGAGSAGGAGLNELRSEGIDEKLLRQIAMLGPAALKELMARIQRAAPNDDIAGIIRKFLEAQTLNSARTVRG